MKKRTGSFLATVFWLSVALTVCLSWAATTDPDALAWAFTCGAVGLIAYMIDRVQEEG